MSQASRRYYRKILLGVLALAALIWVAVDQFEISRELIGNLFLGTVLVSLLVITAAGLLVALWMGLRSLLRHWRSD